MTLKRDKDKGVEIGWRKLREQVKTDEERRMWEAGGKMEGGFIAEKSWRTSWAAFRKNRNLIGKIVEATLL